MEWILEYEENWWEINWAWEMLQTRKQQEKHQGP